MLKNRHISFLTWLLSGMMLLMTGACSSSDEEGQESGADKKPVMLAIYVYAPEQAAAAQKKAAQTRGDVGEVDAITAAEGEIKSLKIWIYESESGDSVRYFETKDVAALNQGQGTTYQIPVSDDFAKNKPDVDVYVMANVTNANCGVETDKNTERDDLMTEAKIVKSKFGLSPLTTEVPTDGLPMAGKLTTQPVVGDAPALRVGSLNAVSTVPLTRAVSKLRFVFAKTTDQPTVRITSIKMNENMIPDVEYLFDKPESAPTITYNTEAGELLSSPIDDIAETADPTDYIYFNQDAQEYENLINTAASKETPEVTVRGPIYLRESDKQLAGTITYTIAGDEQTADFQMQQTGDFLRNHTWIVYAYYAGSGKLQVQTVYVKDWSTKEISHNVYNW
jgi:hypothetical protein